MWQPALLRAARQRWTLEGQGAAQLPEADRAGGPWVGAGTAAGVDSGRTRRAARGRGPAGGRGAGSGLRSANGYRAVGAATGEPGPHPGPQLRAQPSRPRPERQSARGARGAQAPARLSAPRGACAVPELAPLFGWSGVSAEAHGAPGHDEQDHRDGGLGGTPSAAGAGAQQEPVERGAAARARPGEAGAVPQLPDVGRLPPAPALVDRAGPREEHADDRGRCDL
mmetsp:Transcript_71190/g.219686  ORF Transcript_71190/g.219686 Transcript_71190/m.219686 type:complete len:225 (+) Transcript_71190:333-1007(+)